MENHTDLVRAAAERLDLPVVRLPGLIGTPERTLRRWQAGGPMPGAAETLLRLIEAGRITEADLVGARAVGIMDGARQSQDVPR